MAASGLVLATGVSAVLGEAGERARPVEAPPALSVPFGSPAAAQEPPARGTPMRPIFQGVMSPPVGMLVVVDGHLMRLAPGVTIRDQHNRIVLPGTLQGPVPVRFTLDYLGQIHRVKIMPRSLVRREVPARAPP